MSTQKTRSNAPAFWRPAAIMGDRSGIANRRYPYPCLADRTYSRLTAAARSFDPYLNFTHTRVGRFSSSFAGSLLCGERRTFSRSAKSASAGRRLRNEIAVSVSDRDHRVIERCRYVNDPIRNVLSLFLFVNLFLWCCHKTVLSGQWSVVSGQPRFTANCPPPTANYFLPGAFFFATAAFLGPLRVRAFVCVR